MSFGLKWEGREKFGRGNIMLGEKNSIKICEVKELVVTGTVVLAVVGGVWFFGVWISVQILRVTKDTVILNVMDDLILPQRKIP